MHAQGFFFSPSNNNHEGANNEDVNCLAVTVGRLHKPAE